MPDDQSTQPPPGGDDTLQLPPQLQQLIAGYGQIPQVDQTPVDRSFTSLLGEAVGGGDMGLGGMSPAMREAAGNRSLLSFGMGMLQASGYHPVRMTMGEALAAGIQGAMQSEAQSQELGYSALGQRQQMALKQQEMRINALKEALPLLQYTQGVKAATAAANAAGGGGSVVPGTTAGTSLGAPLARDPKAGTVGQQGFNPGNVMADNALPPGAIGWIPAANGRKVAAYPDIATGVAGNAYNLASYAGQGINTVHDAVKTWVGDPKADLTAYENTIAKALGVKPTDKIDLTDPKVQSAFIMAQQPFESGKPWLQQGDVDKGVALAGQWRTKGAPGATTTAGGGGPPPPPQTKATTTPPAAAPPPLGAVGGGAPLATPTTTTAAAPPLGAVGGGATLATPTAVAPPTPPPAEPAAVTAAKAAAAKTGKPVPIAGSQGQQANPDGTIGPVPGAIGGRAAPAAPLGAVGGGATLGATTPYFSRYDVAGTDTGPPTSSLGLIGQAARAAEEGRPPPIAPTPPAAGPAPVPVPVPPTQQPAQPPPEHPDITVGDVTIKHPGDMKAFDAANRRPVPTTADYSDQLPPDQLAAFQAKLNTARAMAAQNPAESMKMTADVQSAIASAQEAWREKAAAARQKWDADETTRVGGLYDKALERYGAAAQSRLAFHQDITKSQADKMVADNTELMKPFQTSAAQASQMLPNISVAKQILPSLPDQASPWLADEKNASRLAVLAPYLPENWRTSIEGAELYRQAIGSMIAQMGANPLSGQTGGREAAYEQFKTMYPSLAQSASTREMGLEIAEQLAMRRQAQYNFLQEWQRDPQHRDPTLGVPNMTGALDAMNKKLGPMPALPPVGFDPETVKAGDPSAQRAQNQFNKLPIGGEYFWYRRGDDGKFHADVFKKLADPNDPTSKASLPLGSEE